MIFFVNVSINVQLPVITVTIFLIIHFILENFYRVELAARQKREQWTQTIIRI